jgi:RNA polymerase sigma-70 factor (ECF subfamily)
MGGGSDWPSTHVTLLKRLREVDQPGDWDLFVQVYGPLLYRSCRRRGLQDADARDVSQEVLLAVRTAIRKLEYDRSKGKFRSWLGTLTARKISRHHRRQQRAGRGAGGPADTLLEIADDDAWDAEFNSHIYDTALARIRPEFEPETWTVFEAVWMREERPRDVATRLGRPATWVYRAKLRVLRRFESEVKFLAADLAAIDRE